MKARLHDVTLAGGRIFTAALLAGLLLPFAGIPLGPRRSSAPPPPAQAPPPTRQPQSSPAERPPQRPPASQRAPGGVTLDVSPRATGQSRLAPAGTANGSSTPLTNSTNQITNPPRSPTPPGFPFGAPGGSYAPAGPSASGPTPGFRSHP